MVEEILLSEIGDEQIEITVIIIIAPGATGRISDICDGHAGGDFQKSPVPLVMI